MATVNLGRIKPQWQGSYASETSYVVDDMVLYNNSAYICTAASQGNAPTNTSYWDLMTQGSDIPSGATSGQLLTATGSSTFAWQDAPASNNASALTTGTLDYSIFPAGAVIQCVTHTHSTAASFSASGTETAITGYAVTITPRYSNSKILVSGHIAHNSAGVTHKLVIKRNGTKIQAGTAAGSRQTALTGLGLQSDTNQVRTAGWWAIDTPSTTSAVTYQMYTAADNGTALFVNRSPADGDNSTGGRHISNIIAWEIAQ